MKNRALIVEDDPQIVNLIADAMASLEHDFDTACSQEEALKRMSEKNYSYILLDIQIPAPQNGVARIQNTENLLEKISGKGKAAPPIIILSDYAVNGLEQTVDVMRLAMSIGQQGAVDIIVKPFPTAGRTLDRVIKKVLGITNGTPISGDTKANDNGDGANGWLTVTQAAELLMHDVPDLDLAKARSRISTAAGRKEFKFTSARKDRRIEPGSFASWRLKQRDRDLDTEDEG